MHRTIPVLLLLFAGCASAGARENAAAAAAGPERDRVDVAVALPPRRAAERVAAAFVAESLTVAYNEGGVVRSEPLYPRMLGMEAGGSLVYTANVTADGDSASRVVVLAMMRGTAGQGAPRPLRSHEGNPVFRQYWPKVERIAARLEAAPR